MDQKTETVYLKEVCRTCLQPNEPLVPIFSFLEVSNSEITKLSTLDLLKLFTGISVSSNDGLPDHICGNCVGILHQSYNFKLKCLKSENISKQLNDDRNHMMDSTNPTIKYEHCTGTDDYETLNEEQDILERSITKKGVSYVQEVKEEQEIEISTEAADFIEPESHENRVINDLQCSICMKAFKSKQNIRNHMAIHTNDFPYKCETSSKTLSYKKELTEHRRIGNRVDIKNNMNCKVFSEKIDDADRPFRCEKCLRDFVRKGNLNRHIETYHSNEVNSFKCPICSKEFTGNNEITKHYGSHSDEKPFKCEICSETFQNTNLLTAHMRTVHSDGKTNNIIEEVSLVKDVNQEKQIEINMKSDDHNETHTSNECDSTDRIPLYSPTDLTCETCAVVASTMSELIEHMKTHAADFPFKCRFCTKIFIYKSKWRSHIRTQHSGGKFSCTKCSETFHSKTQLYQHMKTHNEKQSIQCEVKQVNHVIKTIESELKLPTCSKTVTNKISLKRRTNIRKGEKLFQCEVCSKKFQFRRRLTIHKKLIHAIGTIKNKYECTTCSRFFAGQISLTNHLRIHTGEQPFKCEICSKNFRFKCNLTAHMRVLHTDERMKAKFQCSVCLKLFENKTNLNEHMLAHAEFQCEICQEKFQNKRRLRFHVLGTHGVLFESKQ